MMDKCSCYLRNVALLMPVGICLAWPLKFVLDNRTAGFVGYVLIALTLAFGWLPMLSRWITKHWRIVFAASILAYVAGLVNVVLFLRRAFPL